MQLNTLLATALMTLCVAQPVAAETPNRPNLIVVLIDDFGYECVGANGGVSYQTPHLDALATSGTRFEHCYAQPICTPSRVQLLTGRYNHRNYAGFGYLDVAERTFANELQDAGYATAIVGKWQLNGMKTEANWRDRSRPQHFGFDEHLLWQLTIPRQRAERYDRATFETANERVQLSGDAYGPDRILAAATDFIDRHQAEPFLLYYSMVLTHCPFWPTPDSPQWATPQDRRPGHSYKGDPAFFADQVAYMDGIIGRLVAHLDARGLRNNTLLLVTGDNGTDQPIVSHMADGRRIVGGKGATTDAGTRVPLIASWPGTVPAGVVSDDLVDFSDIFPTLLGAAQVPMPEGRIIDGLSLLPRLRGDSDAAPREWVFCHYWGEKGRTRSGTVEFVRDQQFKLYASGDLFDVTTDPDETTPLSGQDTVRARLAAALSAVHKRE